MFLPHQKFSHLCFIAIDAQPDIKPMLRQCGITDFKGQNKKEAANRLLSYVRDNCTHFI